MIQLIWLIPILPFIGFVLNGLGRNIFPKLMISFVACISVFVSFCISVFVFFEVQAGALSTTIHLFDWIKVGTLDVPLSFLVDPLSATMLLIITGVGFLIHIYSTAYMHSDEGFGKFFAYLNLFIFFMLLLVLGSNYIVMFIGWEGVGLCSYLLIGFWYTNPDYASAAKKAFIMNRIGDLGFLLAVFMLFNNFGSVAYADIFPQVAGLPMGDTTLTIITILLFVAATGKSAQLPLFTWLPDAMAGPTPVSALIHAATMVTAGVYMIVRSNILFTLSPITMEIITIVGLSTAVVAAIIAVTQTDIKKVLAYSTVSQLGYMFLGLGVGSFTGAFFHVMTHAFFKALLFLGAGSVIHALHHEQDMRKMGGLSKKLPITYITMLIGTIAIAGIPPFAGFFSKDEILAAVYAHNPVLWGIAFFGALLTAFYMFRMLYLTFYGKYRGVEDSHHPIHESPKAITIPLIVLAVLSIVAGFLNVPELLGGESHLTSFLRPVLSLSLEKVINTHLLQESTEYILMTVSVLGVLFSVIFAYIKYVKNQEIPSSLDISRGFLERLSYRKFYFDELYDYIIRRPLDTLSVFFYDVMDITIVDGFVNKVGVFISGLSNGFRVLQVGKIGFYVMAMVLGFISFLFYIVVQLG